jgi:hypothetical protein
MLIALLALLGVNVGVLLMLLVVVFARKRWIMGQPGSFRGAIRVADGHIDGLRSKWGRGYGRWVRDVFVSTKAPFLSRNELLATDAVEEDRPTRPGEVKRLGDAPVLIRLRVSETTVDVAASGEHHDLLAGPYRRPPGAEGTV